jgi:PelA/Pel-15E family pectate lyase
MRGFAMPWNAARTATSRIRKWRDFYFQFSNFCARAAMIPRLCIISSVLLGTAHAFGAIIGTNPPALPLTLQRIATLSADRQIQWTAYVKNSERQLGADQQFFQKELSKHHIKQPTTPAEAHNVRGITLDKAADWYAQPEALRIADILVSFQTPAGGWSKNLDMTKQPRAPGERFSADNTSRFPVSSDNDAPRDRNWNYVGTFDNDATVTQLRFLAKVIAAQGVKPHKAYRTAFFRGLKYIFAAQYPNGGWPQVWPLQGGYHDAITYNDDAMVQVLELLRDLAAGEGEFRFVPIKTRARAETSVKRGIECILATQIVVKGRRTVWCQQHDALTLEPCSARNYEMPSQSSAESAQIIQFLMGEANPSREIIAAVHGAAAWFEQMKINDIAYRYAGESGRLLVDAPGSGPLWARYYDIATNRPIFGDRDKTIHDNVNEISKERRNGYAWYRDSPGKALEKYSRWRNEFPAAR